MLLSNPLRNLFQITNIKSKIIKGSSFALPVYYCGVILFLIVNKDTEGLDNMVKKTNQILKNNLYGCINKNIDGDDAYYLNLRG